MRAPVGPFQWKVVGTPGNPLIHIPLGHGILG